MQLYHDFNKKAPLWTDNAFYTFTSNLSVTARTKFSIPTIPNNHDFSISWIRKRLQWYWSCSNLRSILKWTTPTLLLYSWSLMDRMLHLINIIQLPLLDGSWTMDWRGNDTTKILMYPMLLLLLSLQQIYPLSIHPTLRSTFLLMIWLLYIWKIGMKIVMLLPCGNFTKGKSIRITLKNVWSYVNTFITPLPFVSIKQMFRDTGGAPKGTIVYQGLKTSSKFNYQTVLGELRSMCELLAVLILDINKFTILPKFSWKSAFHYQLLLGCGSVFPQYNHVGLYIHFNGPSPLNHNKLNVSIPDPELAKPKSRDIFPVFANRPAVL